VLRSSNDMVGGQCHNLKVEKLADGKYRVSDIVLGDKVAPAIADDSITATRLFTDKLARYDASGEDQK